MIGITERDAPACCIGILAPQLDWKYFNAGVRSCLEVSVIKRNGSMKLFQILINVIAECNTFLLTNFVEKGLGVTFVTSKEFFDHATIKYDPVYDVKNFIQDRLSIYWTKKNPLSDVERDFLEFIISYFRK
jgi:hypothetical protein